MKTTRKQGHCTYNMHRHAYGSYVAVSCIFPTGTFDAFMQQFISLNHVMVGSQLESSAWQVVQLLTKKFHYTIVTSKVTSDI